MEVKQIGALAGVSFRAVATIVRGGEAFTIPREELGDLERLLGRLIEPSVEGWPAQAPSGPAPVTSVPIDAPMSSRKAGLPELWEVLEGVLSEHPKAVGEAILLAAVRRAGHGGDNLTTRVRMVLTRRGKAGLVETTDKGRYRLVRS